MKLTGLGLDLFQGISELQIIDAHEHLPPEAEYLAGAYSGLNLFAGGYIWRDLESAGLASEFRVTMRDGGSRPPGEWWPVIRPHWENVKNTSFARALRITARDLFGIEEIGDDTIEQLAGCVRRDNTPGLYRRVLGEQCHISRCITCVDQAAFPDDPIMRGITLLIKSSDPGPAFLPEGTGPTAWGLLQDLRQRSGRDITTLDGAVEATQSLLWSDVRAGAAGFKTMVAERGRPDRSQADRELQAALSAGDAAGSGPAFQDYLFDAALDVAAEAGIPVAVHTGYWGDFRKLDPKHMLSFALRRRDVSFDLFHLGMPMIRDSLQIGKLLPNVTLNLCWSPVISQVQTVRALDELIDLVPVNKIIAFGGDYRVAVHKVYGHLVMAKEAVAAALGARVEAGDFDFQYALTLARMWFYDNPARIYRLE